MSTATPTNQTNNNLHQIDQVTIGFNPAAAVKALAKDWGWLMAAGIVSVIAGMLAIMAPVLATAAVAMVIAVTLVVVGAFNLAGAFFAPRGLKLESFCVGVMQVLLAAVIAFYPVGSMVSLTVLLAVLLMIDGVTRIALSAGARRESGWGWIMAGGIATLACGMIILAGLPTSSLWAIGILAGVHMLTTGVARIAIASEARRIAKSEA